MIKSLTVRNYAIIESLHLDFHRGLTIITGETGAGKSILLGALGLIMGKRADTRVLYFPERKCVVEGVFDLSPYELRPFFEAHDIDYDAECILRREITPAGKSRAFINDTPVTLPVLRQLCGALIDLHQQFDTLDLHQVSFQLKMVDALAGNAALLERYRQAYQAYQTTLRLLEERREELAKGLEERDFVQFQLEEFEELRLEAGEQDTLEAERDQLGHAEEIKRSLLQTWQGLIEGDNAATEQLRTLLSQLEAVQKYHPEVPALARRLETTLLELRDLAQECERLAEEAEFDPQRLEEVEARLDAIYRLQNKHRVSTVEELLDIQQKLEQRSLSTDTLQAEIEALEAECERRKKELEQLAAELHERRRDAIPAFEEKVQRLLAELAMPHARFRVELHALEALGASGKDAVHFLFAANKGAELQQLKDVASGGELARLTLVTKSLVAKAIPLPTLIFDEIDVGVSGDVALRMGQILGRLAADHQVVCITHSPQIAARADLHYFVYKTDTPERTLARVKALHNEERVTAIAAMLSQNPPTPSALDNARELLALAAEESLTAPTAKK